MFIQNAFIKFPLEEQLYFKASSHNNNKKKFIDKFIAPRRKFT